MRFRTFLDVLACFEAFWKVFDILGHPFTGALSIRTRHYMVGEASLTKRLVEEAIFEENYM